MRTKKIGGKLDLNKRTVANLDNRTMRLVKGGDTASARPTNCISIMVPSGDDSDLGSCDATCLQTCAETCLQTCDDNTCIVNLCPSVTSPSGD